MTHNKCRKLLNNNTIGVAHVSSCRSTWMMVRLRWCRRMTSKVDSFGFTDEDSFQRTRKLTFAIQSMNFTIRFNTVQCMTSSWSQNVEFKLIFRAVFRMIFMVSAEFSGVFLVRRISLPSWHQLNNSIRFCCTSETKKILR